MILHYVVKVCYGTFIGVLGWVCIGISLCIGLLGREIVYVCFRMVALQGHA